MVIKFNLDMAGVIEGTDKSSSVTYAWDYLRHYQRLFRKFRDTEFNFIEIGVGDGPSLKVWKSFFTRARIVGIDIDTRCARFADDRVNIEIGSQDDPAFLARLCAKHPPMIIVDDGSHIGHHIVYAFERMFPSLLPGGMYIVEDISFPRAWGAKDAGEVSAPDYFLRIVESCMARSVRRAADAGTARYTLDQIDSIEFVSGALAVHKKAADRDVAGALAFADEYLRNRVPDAAAHMRVAQYVLKFRGPLDRAESELQRAIELAGETRDLLRTFAELRQRQHHLPEASSMAERAARLSNNPDDWLYAGNLWTQQGDHAAAARAFETGAAIRPGDRGLAFALSNALERQGKFSEAFLAAQKALAAAAGTGHEQQLKSRLHELRVKADRQQ